MIMLASYTANLAAFLTKDGMDVSIESADDLAKQSKIKYGAVLGGSTLSFFKVIRMRTFVLKEEKHFLMGFESLKIHLTLKKMFKVTHKFYIFPQYLQMLTLNLINSLYSRVLDIDYAFDLYLKKCCKVKLFVTFH